MPENQRESGLLVVEGRDEHGRYLSESVHVPDWVGVSTAVEHYAQTNAPRTLLNGAFPIRKEGVDAVNGEYFSRKALDRMTEGNPSLLATAHTGRANGGQGEQSMPEIDISSIEINGESMPVYSFSNVEFEPWAEDPSDEEIRSLYLGTYEPMEITVTINATRGERWQERMEALAEQWQAQIAEDMARRETRAYLGDAPQQTDEEAAEMRRVEAEWQNWLADVLYGGARQGAPRNYTPFYEDDKDRGQKERVWQKAENLLLSRLSPQQQKEYREERQIAVQGSMGGEYVIKCRRGVTQYNIYQYHVEGEKTRVHARYCIAPQERLPDPDVWLSQYLLITTREGDFLKGANTHDYYEGRSQYGMRINNGARINNGYQATQ